ncbi:hypothetical protein FIC_01773 [Flavobacteriaceae bacterium 3519-10]|nr:hypothetical protein FIC_01773 [Flavobacteriaceae bacterium 3519-10]
MKFLSVFIIIFMTAGAASAQQINATLVTNGASTYEILLPEQPNANEKKAAQVLQHYIKTVSGAELKVTTIYTAEKPIISVGRTLFAATFLPHDEFAVKSSDVNIVLYGDDSRSILFAAYHFIDVYLKCRKWAPYEPADCPVNKAIHIPLPIDISEKPSFIYREIYSTAEQDQEYMDWHKLQRLDDLWGLWGHSYFKLVPASNFSAHPEYFGLFKGRRRPLQLCLSNENVFDVAVQTLENLFKDDPAKKYWSVSANDDIGHCECDRCTTVNAAEGGPQGTLIKFINRIAARYPEKTFTTLAYGATARPPLQAKPLSNVTVFLSSVDVSRNEPVSVEKSAAGFRRNLDGWLNITPNVFVWDYYTQFTNYLAPFPDLLNAAPNVDYYQEKQVTGVFAQMGGHDYVDQSDLKTYILARKLWNHEADNSLLRDHFLAGYYGVAAAPVKTYILKLHSYLEESGKKLGIYGNPIGEFNSYLTPEKMTEYYALLDEAEKLADDKKIVSRIGKLKLSLDYTNLQQAKFYGREASGIYTQRRNGSWTVKKSLKRKVQQFGKDLEVYGITALSEAGYTAENYAREWYGILKKEPRTNLATGSDVTFENPWIPDYPAKRHRTLTDGMFGLNDFSYNWLLFDENTDILIDLKELKQVKSVSPSFLEDQRHWIFLPKLVKVSVSADGVIYRELPAPEFILSEQYKVEPHEVVFKVGAKIRYIKLLFEPLEALPEWKSHPFKTPLAAIDEIWIE